MSDTNEITKECLTHYDNQHLQVRKDFLAICVYDVSQFSKEKGNKKEEPNQECMAKILRVFECLTNGDRQQWHLKAMRAKERGLSVPGEPKQYRFDLSYDMICQLLYHTFGESTVRNSIAMLIKMKYIGQDQERRNSIPSYWLNIDTVQKALKKQAEEALSGVEINSHSQVLKSTAKRPKSTPDTSISIPSAREINSQTSEINTNIDIESNRQVDIQDEDANASHARTELIEDIAEVMPDVQANVIRLEAQLPSKESEEIHALPAHGAVHRDVPGPRVSVAAAAQDQASVAGPTATTTPPSADGGATGLSEVDTSHRASLRSGAVGSASPQSSGPRASGKGKAQQQNVTQAELPPAPKFHLTEQEEAFWDLWCGIWFNKDIPPNLTETAYKHVVKLAPYLTTAEQLESLIKHAKKDLEDAQGIKRKTVQLGNLVNSYSGWKQEQQKPKAPSKPKEASPVENKPLPVLAPVRGERRR